MLLSCRKGVLSDMMSHTYIYFPNKTINSFIRCFRNSAPLISLHSSNKEVARCALTTFFSEPKFTLPKTIIFTRSFVGFIHLVTGVVSANVVFNNDAGKSYSCCATSSNGGKILTGSLDKLSAQFRNISRHRRRDKYYFWHLYHS